MESSYGGTDVFEELGRAKKEGMLKKKSPVLGMWKQRYVVLDGSALVYYKSQAEYTSGAPGKAMRLSPSSMTSFTPVENCFTIRQADSLSMRVGAAKATSKIRRTSLASTKAANSSAEAAGDNAQWFILTSNENELYEWVTAISAHVHVVHMQQITYEKNLTDHMATGVSSVCFYEAPMSSSSAEHKLPIGIRTIPEITGPRTGDAIYPGEVCEVVHRFEANGNAFLRLAANRGWIFEKHPSSGEPLVTIAGSGVFEEKNVRYIYPAADSNESIPIRFGPCVEARATGDVVDPGEAEVRVCGLWIPAAGTAGGEFLKLSGNQGWIPYLGALKEVAAAPDTSAASTSTDKKSFRRSSINMARRPVDIRSGSTRVASKDAMVSRRKSNLTLEEAVECL